MNKQLIFSSSKVTQGNMSYLYGKTEEVDQNKHKFLDGLGLSLEHCVLIDVSNHGDDILDVSHLDAGKGMIDQKPAPLVDALITHVSNLAIGLLTADCFPVVVADKNKTIIGLAHLGWKGVDLELLSKLIERMSMMNGILTENFDIQIGPGAAAESYIVSSKPKQIDDPRWREYVKELEDGRYQIDLQSFIVSQAVQAGVLKTNITESKADTITNPDYFSYRRSTDQREPEGRILTIAALKA